MLDTNYKRAPFTNIAPPTINNFFLLLVHSGAPVHIHHHISSYYFNMNNITIKIINDAQIFLLPHLKLQVTYTMRVATFEFVQNSLTFL